MFRWLWPRGYGKNNRRHNGTRALVCAVAALGAVTLAACGSVAAPGSGPGAGQTSPGTPGSSTGGGVGSSQPALCRDAATVTRLEIVRNHGFKVPELEPAFPNLVTVTNPALVRDVARALCALPAAPKSGGVYHCPALLLGTAYTLRFSLGSRPLPLVTINSTGCETVTGVGPVRWVTSEGFWAVLSRAIGVKTPPVFGGDIPGSACQPGSTHLTKIDGCPGVARPGTEVVAPAAAAAS
jgi:hypothetical protein